jgi:hypothetical protein
MTEASTSVRTLLEVLPSRARLMELARYLGVCSTG